MSKAIVFFADGFEECEGLLVVDLLRRAGVDVKTASINGSTKILSSHGITLFADLCAEDADYAAADIVILPGGLKGTENLAANSFVKEKCRKSTVHPNFEDKMSDAELTHEQVTVDGNITTGQALGAAIPFALELIRQLEGEEKVAKVRKGICF